MENVNKGYLIGVDIREDDLSVLVVAERTVQDGKSTMNIVNTFHGKAAERIYKFLTRPRTKEN